MSQKNHPSIVDLGGLSVEQAVARLIEYAGGIGASDIFLHTEPQGLSAQVRHLGIVKRIAQVPLEQGRRFISHERACAGMDVTEKRRPVDGRSVFETDDGSIIDLRINSIPTINGEDLAIRLLVRESHLLTLDNLGLTTDQYNLLSDMLDTP